MGRQISIPIKEQLLELYYNNMISTNGLAKYFGVSKGTIYNWMQKYAIDTRSVSQGVSIAQTGTTHSPEWNQAISKGHTGKRCPHMEGGKNPVFKSTSQLMHRSRSISGKRTDLNGLYVRSSWEANYCRYLNFLIKTNQIVKWEYEPDTFEFKMIKRGARFYIPDFKIFLSNGSHEYHEVKGYMSNQCATKIRRLRKFFPAETLLIIDKERYKAIAKQFNKILPFWE